MGLAFRLRRSKARVINQDERIAPSGCESVFEPFLLNGEPAPGTGLGLGIAKELIDKRRACD